jgi:hypothetical protein
VVVAYGSNDVLPGCFAALRISIEEAGLTRSDATRVIVVDNSPDDPAYVPDRVPWSHSVVVPEGNLGFSPAVNLALSHIEDVDYVLLLNPDARPQPDSIRSKLTTALERGTEPQSDRFTHFVGSSEPSFWELATSLLPAVIGPGKPVRPGVSPGLVCSPTETS